MLKEGLRAILTFFSVLTVLLFFTSIAIGCQLYFGPGERMELFIVDYSTGQPVVRPVESPHPYTANWTDKLVLRVPHARLKFENITLEEGDTLIVEQVGRPARWTWSGNGTDVVTSTFYAGPDGAIELVIRIADDGDGRTAWGVKARTYITDIWSLRARPYLLIVILPVVLPPVRAWVLAAFMQAFFTAMILACWAHGLDFARAVAGGHRRPLLKTLRNPLFAMPFVSTSLFTATVGLVIIMEMLGVSAGLRVELPGPLAMLFETTYAVIAEEVGFRLVLIGVPLSLAAAIKAGGRESRLSAFLKSLFCPGSLDPEVRRRLRGLMAFLVVVSSIIFGLTHVLFGGWEIGKAVTATLAGLVMALCFTSYGLHASLLLHWFFNYHIQVWFVAYELLGPPYDLAYYAVITYELALGALSLLMFAIQGVRLAVWRGGRQKEEGFGALTWSGR